MLRSAIGRPSCVRRISGSLPRLPTRITLFTLPAITALHSISPAKNHWQNCWSPRRLPAIPDLSPVLGLLSCLHSASGSGHPDDLYTRGLRRLSDPSGSPRLSTYSIARADVPALFSKLPDLGLILAIQPRRDS